MTLAPPARPNLSRIDALGVLVLNGISDHVALLGVRGYYRRTMGDPASNDRGIYDDAIFLVGVDGHYSAYNANTDPSIYRPRVASLKAGVWRYRLGIHGLSKPKHLQYRALVQAEPVTVARDGAQDESGWFGINIHRGGVSGTSSLGCQTILASQWPAFIAAVQDQLHRAGQRTIPYLLVDGLPA